MTPDSSVIQALHSLTHWTALLILPLVGIAALTMTILQTIKNMFRLRYWFQRSFVESWLAGRTVSAPEPQMAGAASFAADPVPAKEHLVRLAASGDAHALYSLPIEQLCGQINASTQVLLDYPKLHWSLLKALAGKAHGEDLDAIRTTDQDKLKEFSRTTPDEQKQLRSPAEYAANRKQLADYVEVRNRISHQIQRSVDALQISVSLRWKFWLQFASILISAFLGFIALVIVGHPLDTLSAATFILLSGIFSGLIASSARDLLAALERIRK